MGDLNEWLPETHLALPRIARLVSRNECFDSRRCATVAQIERAQVLNKAIQSNSGRGAQGWK